MSDNNEFIKLDDNRTIGQRIQILKELFGIEQEATDGKKPSVFGALREWKKRGLWTGEIEEIIPKEYNITPGKGEHYFVIENPQTYSVACISCPVRHGHILEAHMLARYRIEKGVIYLDDHALNRAPNRPDLTEDNP